MKIGKLLAATALIAAWAVSAHAAGNIVKRTYTYTTARYSYDDYSQYDFVVEKDLRYSSSIPSHANYVVNNLPSMESRANSLITATGYSPSNLSGLNAELTQMNTFISEGNRILDDTEPVLTATEAQLRSIYTRHENAVQKYVDSYESYAQRVLSELSSRKSQALSYWSSYAGPTAETDTNPNYDNISITTSGAPESGTVKTSLTSIYNCVHVKGGVFGYWVMSGADKGRFVPVSNPNNTYCRNGQCVCESKI